MAEWGAAVEVDGLPSSASIDELSVLLSQLAHCRQHHILLSSRGASSAVAALVLLPSDHEASTAAELLDSYPLSGGLLETRLCADPAGWAQRHMMQLLPNGGSSRQQASQPQGPPAPQPLQPPAPQPLPPPAQPVASSASGLAALEAEAREVQRMLQEQQQLLGGGTSGGGWEGQEEGASSDSEGEWSQVVGKAAPKRGSSGSGSGTAAAAPRRPGSSRGSGGQHPITATPTSKLFVGHILGGVTVKDLEAVFSRFGPVYDLELRRANGEGRSDQWAFVNFQRKQDALAAYEQLEWQLVPELSGRRPLKLQFRSA